MRCAGLSKNTQWHHVLSEQLNEVKLFVCLFVWLIKIDYRSELPSECTNWQNELPCLLRDMRMENEFYSVYTYTECPRRNVRDFGRVFLMLNYTDITQNTYIQSWTVTEIMAIEKCGLLGGPRTVRRPWRHTHPLRMPGNETSLTNIVMQWPWRVRYKITDQLRPA